MEPNDRRPQPSRTAGDARDSYDAWWVTIPPLERPDHAEGLRVWTAALSRSHVTVPDDVREDAARYRFFVSRFEAAFQRHALAKMMGCETTHFDPSISEAIDAAMLATKRDSK